MAVEREEALELVVAMLLVTAELQGVDVRNLVDSTGGLISRAGTALNKDAGLVALALSELSSSHANMLAAKQKNER